MSEDSVVVSDSVSERGDIQCCHGVQETCSKSSESAVAKSGIGLYISKFLVGVPQVLEGLGDLVLETHVRDVVGHGTTHEELK